VCVCFFFSYRDQVEPKREEVKVQRATVTLCARVSGEEPLHVERGEEHALPVYEELVQAIERVLHWFVTHQFVTHL